MTITIEEAWFNLASDPEQYVALELTGEQDQTEKRASLLSYTQGRRRSVTRPGTKQTLSVSFEGAAREQSQQLKDWLGEIVVYRDPRGRRVFCQYFDVDVEEITGADNDIVDVSLTLHEITYDETV